jgi:hypothetical protein
MQENEGIQALYGNQAKETPEQMNIQDIENLSVDGVDPTDYPDFSDAYFYQGNFKSTGLDLTDEELDNLAEEEPELLHEMAYESLF